MLCIFLLALNIGSFEENGPPVQHSTGSMADGPVVKELSYKGIYLLEACTCRRISDAGSVNTVDVLPPHGNVPEDLASCFNGKL